MTKNRHRLKFYSRYEARARSEGRCKLKGTALRGCGKSYSRGRVPVEVRKMIKREDVVVLKVNVAIMKRFVLLMKERK